MIAWNDFPEGDHRTQCPACNRRDKSMGVTVLGPGHGVAHCFRCGYVETRQTARELTPAERQAFARRMDALKVQHDAEQRARQAEVAAAAAIANHADLQALQDRAAVAEGALALAATQSRASPALTLAANRERGSRGEAFQQTFALGLRIPFGAGPRHDARVASARADAVELQAQLALERARIAADQAAARARSDAARAQVVAADRRAQLALEARGFFDKSFRLGETDLPSRLRIEAEAADAQRQAARARIELAAAMSAWRQALGLLPP